MGEHTKGKVDYVGDVAVGVYADCDCEELPHPDCESNGCVVYHTVTPHECHEVVIVCTENDLPDGLTLEKHIANCQRIVALWNAADDAGLSTAEIEYGVIRELISALEGLRSLSRKDTSNPKYDRYFQAAEKALAKVKL